MYQPIRPNDILAMNWNAIPAEPIPDDDYVPPVFDTRPITKEEYLNIIDRYRVDSNFMRLPLASWAYEELPEFAETREQLAYIQAEYAERVQKAMEIDDIKEQEEALKDKIAKMKKLAKKNKALRRAKAKLLELEKKRAELEEEASDEEIDISRVEPPRVFSGQSIDGESKDD